MQVSKNYCVGTEGSNLEHTRIAGVDVKNRRTIICVGIAFFDKNASVFQINLPGLFGATRSFRFHSLFNASVIGQPQILGVARECWQIILRLISPS